MDQRLNRRPETTKLLKENLRSKILDTDLGNIFFWKYTTNINMLDYIKLKRFCMASKQSTK